jgi:carboxyl-terminal processing protease
MKSIIGLLIFLACSASGTAQNPVSYPKDTAVSKPELNFEVLWHTFEDNYAFFKLRHIDWKKAYKTYRPLVKAGTSDDSLFNIFCKMLAPFQDDHINLIVPQVKAYKPVKPSTFKQEFGTDSLREAFRQMVDHTLQRNNFAALTSIGPAFRNKPLFQYGTSGAYGYLRFNRCFVDGDADGKEDAVLASQLLDTIFTAFKNVQALIIDVRDNMGGNDEFSFEVAGRFTAGKRIGMYKQTRISGGGYEQFGQKETWFLEPKGRQPFVKPVIVLTNDKTASAGDVFAMIMQSLPQTTLIGTNSCGIYSDMYGFTLPNGWLLSLSHQRYYNSKMICYEGTGTPVNIKIKNTRADLLKQQDPVLAAALKQLSSGKNNKPQ